MAVFLRPAIPLNILGNILMGKPKIERKVLRLFGRIIRPANWTIFVSGIVLIPVGVATLWFDLSVRVLGAILISLQGVDFLISGYGEVKDDEQVA